MCKNTESGSNIYENTQRSFPVEEEVQNAPPTGSGATITTVPTCLSSETRTINQARAALNATTFYL